MAIAEKYLEAHFNRDRFRITDHRIFVFAGDGCLQEGVSSEASSLAGHLGLNNLIVVYDDNHITIDGETSLSFSEDVAKRYEAYNWFVQKVPGDGNDIASFERALVAAKGEEERPSLIMLRTHIGYGSPNKQDSHDAHGSPLGDDEVALTKKRYGWDPEAKFHIPAEALSLFRKEVGKGKQREDEWKELFRQYAMVYPDLAAEFRNAAAGNLPENWVRIWDESMHRFDSSTAMATREAQGMVLDAIMPKLPLVIGGSADLTPSNNTRFKGATDFSKANRSGRYIRYGVREHGMGAIMNGIAVSGMIVPYGATFFCFTDYMRPSIRLAALSKYPAIFVYTHDSIGLGEDGPTHQAVEHLASFRAMPGMIVLRPADAHETAHAWKFALEHRTGPVMIVLSRQKVPVLDQATLGSAANVIRGAYILTDTRNPRVLLLSSGSEVHLALRAHEQLRTEGIGSRVISVPSWELFEIQSKEYRDRVLPPSVTARVAVEAGVRLGWERYLGAEGEFVGMSTFGSSAPADAVFSGFGITVQAIVDAAKRVTV
jgi:transketolase